MIPGAAAQWIAIGRIGAVDFTVNLNGNLILVQICGVIGVSTHGVNHRLHIGFNTTHRVGRNLINGGSQ